MASTHVILSNQYGYVYVYVYMYVYIYISYVYTLSHTCIYTHITHAKKLSCVLEARTCSGASVFSLQLAKVSVKPLTAHMQIQLMTPIESSFENYCANMTCF